jgi:hypothetical protein
MRILTAAVILATAATATAAFAQSERLTDAQYIAAARCSGLMQGADAGAINAKLKAQASSRVTVVLDRADAARKDGARKARKATGAGGKAEVAREISTNCAAFTG